MPINNKINIKKYYSSALILYYFMNNKALNVNNYSLMNVSKSHNPMNVDLISNPSSFIFKLNNIFQYHNSMLETLSNLHTTRQGIHFQLLIKQITKKLYWVGRSCDNLDQRQKNMALKFRDNILSKYSQISSISYHQTNTISLLEEALKKIINLPTKPNQNYSEMDNNIIYLSMSPYFQFFDNIQNYKQPINSYIHKTITKPCPDVPFLQDQELINKKLNQIAAGEISLSDLSCLGCTKVFTYRQNINEFMSQNSNIALLTSYELFDQDLLQKTFCSLANHKIGILIGCVNKHNHCLVEGYNFSQQQSTSIINIMHSIKKTIFPAISILINFIPIFNDPNNSVGKQCEQGRYCVRVVVKPLDHRKMHAICITNKGYDSIYEIYKENRCGFKLLTPHEIYQQMTSKKYKPDFIHFGGQCCSIVTQKSFAQKLNSFEESQSIFDEDKLKELEPILRYQHSALMIVGSEKKTIFLKKFSESLEKQKINFSLQRPFLPISKKCGRKIFFFSYESKTLLIKDLLAKYDKGKNIKFIPLEKCLRVPVKKIDEDHLNYIKQKYSEVYNEDENPYELTKIDAIMSTQQKQLCYFFKFNDLAPMILTYILFESISIKPFVLKFAPKGVC